MLGPYEIEYEGRKYFGNIALREFHVFRHDGDCCLFDVERLTSRMISECEYRTIEKVLMSSESLVSEKTVETLRGHGLVACEDNEAETSAPESTKDAGDDDPQKDEAFEVGSIYLFIAQECNMRCVYCYGEGGSYGEGGMMSDETAFKAVDWLLDNSKSAEQVKIFFFGGEPLLNFPLMKRVVAYSKEKAGELGKKVTFGITTNATLITDEVISFMSEEKMDPLISFDGPPEIQNRQRPFKDGGGSYDTAYANILKMREAFPRLKARATIYGDADPFEIMEGIGKAGFSKCILSKASRVILSGPNGQTVTDEMDEKTTGRMIAIMKEEGDSAVRAVKGRRVGENLGAETPENLRLLQTSVTDIIKILISRRKRYFGCGAGKGIAAISVSGDVYPCHRFVGQEDAIMGNIESYKPEGINDYYRAVVQNLPDCRACWARYLCGGGCFYENKARTGDIRRADESFCRKIKAASEIAIHAYLQLDEADREFVHKTYSDRSDEKLP